MVLADCYPFLNRDRRVYFLYGMGLFGFVVRRNGIEYHTNGYFLAQIQRTAAQRVPDMLLYGHFGNQRAYVECTSPKYFPSFFG